MLIIFIVKLVIVLINTKDLRRSKMKGKKQLFGFIMAVSLVVILISGAFAAKAQLVDIKAGDNMNIRTKEIKNTDQYTEVDIKIPVIEGLGNKDIQSMINISIEKDAENFKSEIEKQAKEGFEEAKKGDYPFHTYQAFIECKVTYSKNNILSIPISYYSYTGGAHGMTNIISRNINLKTGGDIALKDIFKEGTDYKDIIKQEVIKQIKLEPEVYFEDAIKTVNESNEEFSFYLEDGNIVVYYSLYSIAPYASGIREFKIPLDTFKDGINQEFTQLTKSL